MKKIILLGLICFLFLPINYFYIDATSADAGVDYYVSNDGSDSNDGLTTLTPWRTVGKVNSELTGVINQGDNIYFNRGDTFSDNGLTIRRGGTSSNWMVIGAYGTGANPIISGNNDNNNMRIQVSGLGYIRVENITLRNSNANGFQCILVTNDLTLYNVDVENSGTNAIRITYVNRYKLENCDVVNAGLGGILIYGNGGASGSRNGKIMHCTSTDATTDGFTYHVASTGIGANHYIFNCTSKGSGENGFDITSGSNIYVLNCSASGSSISPFVCGHDVQDVVIEGFNSINDPYGILATETDNLIVRNSIISFTNLYIVYIYGATSSRWVYDTAIYNNDIIWDSGSGVMHFNRYTQTHNIKNNIFYSTVASSPGTFLNVVNGDLSTYDMYWNNNMWWRGDGLNGNHWTVNGVSYSWSGWTGLSRVTGDLKDDPEFVDDSNFDFSLQSTSPCIDAGAWLTITDGSGSSSNTVTVDEANYFFDGISNLPDSNILGDNIFVGSNTNLVITDVNYATNVITVNRSITWSDGDFVSLSNYKGNKPDIGAIESPVVAPEEEPPEISDIILTESDPLDTDPTFGWINITATITGSSPIDNVYVDISGPSGSVNVSMNPYGLNGYYYNTSTIFTNSGDYSYYIWADDTMGNSSTSNDYSFSMPPNWDIDMNGLCNVLDLVFVINHDDESGSSGWIREDFDNNGIINMVDFVQVTQHIYETW